MRVELRLNRGFCVREAVLLMFCYINHDPCKVGFDGYFE